MRVVVAPDKFKGTLSAAEAARAVAAGITKARPDAQVVELPVADGGDGTLEAALAAGFSRVPVRVTGPTGQPVDAAIGVRDDVAVVELALASGLTLLPGGRPDPLGATSRGTGELIRAALDTGCAQVVLGVGGSACTDGGAGLVQALGARLLDASGAEISPGGGGLARLDTLDMSGLDARLGQVGFTLASDVVNVLLGEQGAAAVYGPQKGASPDDVALLDAALARWASLVDPDAADLPGAGAAGGVGYAALALLGARRRPGIDVVLDLVGLADHLAGADLVVTGEGSLDEQTLAGKAPAGVAAAAAEARVAVVAVCGQCRLDEPALRQAGFVATYALTEVEPDLDRCMADPAPLLRELARRVTEDCGRGSNGLLPERVPRRPGPR